MVPPELIKLPEDYLWGLFDENLLIVIDRLREALNRPITVNNWKSGGKFSLRGFRPKNCKIGAPKSAHKRGLGLDFEVEGMTAQEVRDYIISHQKMFPEITRMEQNKLVDGTLEPCSWVHIDCVDRDGWKWIKLFNG